MTEQLRGRIDAAATAFEEKRANLFRADGSRLFADEAHKEHESALRREFHSDLDHISGDIERRIETAEQESHRLAHADPSGSLSRGACTG